MCQEHHWRSEVKFFLAVQFVFMKIKFPSRKKWELQSPNKTRPRLKIIILFSQHSFIWVFHFLSLMKQKEIMFVPISWITYRLDYPPVKPERLTTAMLISRKWLEWDPWWHNSQRQCMKPVKTRDKISLLVFIHSYRWNWGLLSLMQEKQQSEQSNSGCFNHELSDCNNLVFQRPIPDDQNVLNVKR